MAGVIPKHHVQIASNLYVNTSCLNEDDNAPHVNVLNDCDDRFCSSDADEQLLFRLPFKAAVKLSALKIQCPNAEQNEVDGSTSALRPKKAACVE